MERVAVLMRGVNVGGRRVAMAQLRDGLITAGCVDVRSYVQSGNLVLSPPGNVATDELSGWLSRTCSDIAGFEIEVVTRSGLELKAIHAANPYAHAAGKQLHVVFLDKAAPALLDELTLDDYAPEHATIGEREIYLHLPDGMGRSQLAVAVERAVKRTRAVLATTRNWNTVEALVDLL